MSLEMKQEITQRRRALREHFGLNEKQARSISEEMLVQLELCADDDARRTLLKGKKRKAKQMTISEVYGNIEIK